VGAAGPHKHPPKRVDDVGARWAPDTLRLLSLPSSFGGSEKGSDSSSSVPGTVKLIISESYSV